MGKVWIIIKSEWNGENNEEVAIAAFSTMEKACDRCAILNKYTSFLIDYRVEELDLED